MHGYCLELLANHLKPGARCLDVGSGSGYLTAAMAYMACVHNESGGIGDFTGPAATSNHLQRAPGKKADGDRSADGSSEPPGAGSSGAGCVVGVEHIPQLVTASLVAVQRIPWAAPLLSAGRLQLLAADGRAGYPQGAPYDAIHVGAAAPALPAELVGQLAPGGRLVVPVGVEDGAQQLVVVDRMMDGSLDQHSAMGVLYVPLTSKERQMQRARRN